MPDIPIHYGERYWQIRHVESYGGGKPLETDGYSVCAYIDDRNGRLYVDGARIGVVEWSVLNIDVSHTPPMMNSVVRLPMN